jgi:hypothetical protein
LLSGEVTAVSRTSKDLAVDIRAFPERSSALALRHPNANEIPVARPVTGPTDLTSPNRRCAQRHHAPVVVKVSKSIETVAIPATLMNGLTKPVLEVVLGLLIGG